MQGKSQKPNRDLIRRTYNFALDVINYVKTFPNNDPASKIIGGQLIRSATSIGANLVEAQAASSKREFTNYYRISLRSANESKFWLPISRDAKLGDPVQTNKLLNENIELANIIASCIISLKKK